MGNRRLMTCLVSSTAPSQDSGRTGLLAAAARYWHFNGNMATEIGTCWQRTVTLCVVRQRLHTDWRMATGVTTLYSLSPQHAQNNCAHLISWEKTISINKKSTKSTTQSVHHIPSVIHHQSVSSSHSIDHSSNAMLHYNDTDVHWWILDTSWFVADSFHFTLIFWRLLWHERNLKPPNWLLLASVQRLHRTLATGAAGQIFTHSYRTHTFALELPGT